MRSTTTTIHNELEE